MTSIVVIYLIYIIHLEGHHEGFNNGEIPRGMKSYLIQFSRIPYIIT
jgi:hypothetical protein